MQLAKAGPSFNLQESSVTIVSVCPSSYLIAKDKIALGTPK